MSPLSLNLGKGDGEELIGEKGGELELKLCTPYGGRFLDLLASTGLSQNNFDC